MENVTAKELAEVLEWVRTDKERELLEALANGELERSMNEIWHK